MEIKNGSYIKIICGNNLIGAGKLIEYTADQLVLELLDKSFLIIQKPYDNVLAIKIFGSEMQSRVDGAVFVDTEPKPDKYYPREDLRAMNIAELYKLKAQEERNRAVQLLRSHTPKEITEVQFGTPNLSKPISHNPPKKVRRSH